MNLTPIDLNQHFKECNITYEEFIKDFTERKIKENIEMIDKLNEEFPFKELNIK